MIEGCEHCGTVVRRQGDDARRNCKECGRPLKRIDPYEAKVLMRERRVAEQFRRMTRLTRTMDARRSFGVRPG